MSEHDRTPSLLQPPWSGMSLPGLVKGGATLRAGALALVEPPEVEGLLGRAAQAMTCRDLNVEVDLCAQKLRALGLKAGNRVVLSLPNTAEATVALLAVQRAGGIPAPMGIFEEAARLAEAARCIDAVAIVTVARFAGIAAAERARDAAAAEMSIRFVAAFGDDLPEGVAGLDHWDQVEFIGRTGFPRLTGTAPALISFDDGTGVLRPLMRTHEQLVAEAASAASLSRVSAGSRVLATLPPVTAAGVVYGLALPLLAGACLAPHPLFDSCAFGAQLGEGEKTTVVLPGVAAEAWQAHCATRSVRTESLVLIHRPQPDDLGALPAGRMRRDPRTVDVLALGEAALVSSLRATNQTIVNLPASATCPVPGVMQGEAPALTLALGEAGRLVASGALAAHPLAGSAPLDCGFCATRRDTRGFTLVSAQKERGINAA
mgnify:CR=1 FL=1